MSTPRHSRRMARLALALSASMLSLPAASDSSLIGQWTFEPGTELTDSTHNWGQLELMGNASISGGQLHVNGSGTRATGWARALGTEGTIGEKTLVSWVNVRDYNARAGSAMTIDNINGDNFDAIVYAERQHYRWMAGSSWFRRTADVVRVDDRDFGTMRQMAISYRFSSPGYVEITICRDGQRLGQYVSRNPASWNGDNAEILFGMRHSYGNGGPGALNASIEEARIYNRPMSCPEVGALTPEAGDRDNDGVPDEVDNCPAVANADQADRDSDGAGDACDADLDGDGTDNEADNCPFVPNADQADLDNDGLGDVCDPDLDGDGTDNGADNCPSTANSDQADFDGDGAGDVCDPDADADGVANEDDACDRTPLGAVTDGAGCSGAQQVEQACPSSAVACAWGYKNHGQYVSCVTKAAQSAWKQGLLSKAERQSIRKDAAQSSCGK